ncbi:MAG TPA: HupE/UreJ family protein, partial [Stellaceae bacterium]|nr:HupE/UreJ family protein [Stellaceae bacterium]
MPRSEEGAARVNPGGAILLAASLMLLPRAAAAHVAFAEMGSFWAGVLYPLTALDQVGFLLGLAILASFQRRRAEVGLVVAVFLGCAAGSAAGHAFGWPSAAGAPIAALMILVG